MPVVELWNLLLMNLDFQQVYSFPLFIILFCSEASVRAKSPLEQGTKPQKRINEGLKRMTFGVVLHVRLINFFWPHTNIELQL